MSDIPLLTEDELIALSNAKNKYDWNETCDKIKAVRSGWYPPDWYVKVIASGFMSRVADHYD
jgi:hypothetical protein